jgi:hypothetical protein
MLKAECPFCQAPQSISPQSAGRIVLCRSCKRTFRAPARESAPPAAPKKPVPSAPAVPMGPRVSAPADSAFPLPVCGPPAAARVPASVTPAPGQPEVPGVVALSAATWGGGCVVQSGMEPPAATEEESPPGEGQSSGLVAICLLGGIMCLLVGGMLLVLVLALLSHRREDRPTAGRKAHPQLVVVTPKHSTTVAHADVSQHVAISLNDVAVDVKHVEYGEVRAKDANNRVIVFSGNRLQIFLEVKNLNPGPIKYTSWHGNRFGEDQETATLTDNLERWYAPWQPEGTASVRGHTPGAVLASRDKVDDVLIFSVPPAVDRAAIRHFRLELPAAAYGAEGSYRFEIPCRIIQGF